MTALSIGFLGVVIVAAALLSVAIARDKDEEEDEPTRLREYDDWERLR